MEAPLYALDQISKVPVSMYVGEKDFLCTPKVTEAYSEQFETLQNLYTFKNASKDYFKEQAG